MRISRALVAAAVAALCILALSAAAFAATASVTGLSSPTHPLGQWTSSADPVFEWSHSIDREQFALLGAYNTPGEARGVAISGTTAYVADDTSGLQIIDISNPAAPTLRGTYDTTGVARGIAISGTTAYVADDTSGLRVIDVSNPAAPTLIGTYDTPGYAAGVAVSGTTAYVADGLSGLQVIDVSNPAAPTLRGTYDTTGVARGVAISGTTAYVANDTSGLQVIDTGILAVSYSYDLSTATALVPDAIPDSSQQEASFVGLTDGVWYLHLRPVFNGVAGAVSTVSVWIDTTDPVLDIVVAPSAPTSQPVSVSFLASDAMSGLDQVWYRVNGGLPQLDTGAPFGIDVPGQHVVEAWAFDIAGNLTIETAAVTIDQIAPVASDDAQAGWVTADTTVTITATDTITGVAGINWARTEPGGALTAGSANAAWQQFAVSAEGTSTIEYSAIDDVGNRCATQTATVRLDMTVPSTTATHAAGWQSAPVTVTLTSADGVSGVAHTRYRIGAGATQSYTVPFAVDASGETTVTYFSVDAASNTEAEKTTVVRHDTGAPTVSDDAPTGWVNTDVDVTLRAMDTGAGVAWLRWLRTEPGGATSAGSAAADSQFLSVTATGTTTIEYSAVDLAGNPCATETAVVRLDKAAPMLTVTPQNGIPSGMWVQRFSQDVMVTAADDLTTPMVFVSVDGGPYSANPFSNGAGLMGTGWKLVSYYAVDEAGNATEFRNYACGLDPFWPTAAVTAPYPGVWTRGPVTVGASGDDALAPLEKVTLNVEGLGMSEFPQAGSVTIFDEGKIDVGYRAYTSAVLSSDGLGGFVKGMPSVPATTTVWIDSTEPSTGASAPAVWQSESATVTLIPTDPSNAADGTSSGAFMTFYRIGSESPRVYGGPFAIDAEGLTVVTYWSEDWAGNAEKPKALTVRVDKAAPEVSDDVPSDWVAADTTVTISAVDAGSGVAAIDWLATASDGATTTGSVAAGPAIVPVTAEGTTTIEYFAVDLAGHRCATQTATVKLDKTAPSAMLSDAGSTNYAARLSLDGTDNASGVTLHWAIGVEPTQTLAADHADIVYTVPGTFTVTAWAVDGAGNASTRTTREIAVVGPAEIGMRTGSKTLGNYGAPFALRGVLTSGDVAVAGGRVELQKSSDGVRFYSASRYATTTADGAFSFSVVPRVRTIYRARALSEPGRAEVVGPAVLAMPRARVGNAVTPVKQAVGKGYRVEGTLRPHRANSSVKVRVYMWRLEGKKWVRYGYRTGKLTNYKSYSKYRAVIFPQKPGKWRVRVYHKDFDHAASWSSKYTYFRVH